MTASFRVSATIILLPALLVIPWWRSQSLARPPRAVQWLPQPTAVQPQYNYPVVISDEQLTAVLDKLRPRLRGGQPKINHVDHALRFWGSEARFADPECLSGAEMRAILTDHRRFASAWGKAARPLLVSRPVGLAVRTQQGNATASHVDHTLGTLAECGTPLDFPIIGPERRGTVRDLLDQTLASFQLNQHEYEWTALVFALYARDGSPWYTDEGERIDFNRLADRLMRQPYIHGVCFGNHRLFTLTMLLRLDDSKHLLSSDCRAAIHAHLAEATRRLVSTQSPEGFWDRNWYNSAAEVRDEVLLNAASRRFLATGHALEWWAMAPADLHPPREVLARAGQWLAREVLLLDDKQVDEQYTFLTHVGRALSLWRGHFPPRLSSTPAAQPL